MPAPDFNQLNNQRGTVLLVSLIILTVMTVISLSMMSNSTMEEKMAANQMNNHLTFHAAESATEIMVGDSTTLASALASSSDITQTVDVGDSSISASVTLSYVGDAVPTGWSLGDNEGSFVAYNIRATGTATKPNAHASTSTAQGISRIGPRY
jgi:uncharacterized membrane protein YeiB